MANKEATARIKINKLLEGADWRFFPDGTKPANIRLEARVTSKSSDLEALGKNFEKTSTGFVDFLAARHKRFTVHRARPHKTLYGPVIVHCYRGFNLAGIVEQHKIDNDQASQSSTEVLMKSSTGIP